MYNNYSGDFGIVRFIIFNNEGNKFLYTPKKSTYEEIDFLCYCRDESKSKCVNTFWKPTKSGYFLFESKALEGITITYNTSQNSPRGKIKREVVKMIEPSFWVYFGNNSEHFVIIDIEPKFNKEWCSKATKLSLLAEEILNPEFKVECGDGMKQ